MPVPVRQDRRCRNQPSADRGHLEDHSDSKADPELLDGRVAVEPKLPNTNTMMSAAVTRAHVTNPGMTKRLLSSPARTDADLAGPEDLVVHWQSEPERRHVGDGRHRSGQLEQTAEQAGWKIAVSTPYATTIDNTFATQPALGSLTVRKARVSGVKLSAIGARIRRGSLAEVVDVGSS
jgi:hypothetical protein